MTHINPRVRKHAGPAEEVEIQHMEVAYEEILGQATSRLIELRAEWSEMGALHRVLDELSCRISFYWYINQKLAGLFMDNIEKNEEYDHRPEIHPRAVELFRQDRALARWMEVSPRAAVVLPNTSADHYLTTLSKQRAKLHELREQEGVSELGALYTLLDEACAEAACKGERAKMETWRFFEKRKAA